MAAISHRGIVKRYGARPEHLVPAPGKGHLFRPDTGAALARA